MALSQESLDLIEAAKAAIEEYLAVRQAEIDDLAANLRNYGVPLNTLSTESVESATSAALEDISTLLA